MDDNLLSDLDALEEVSGLLERLAVGSTGSPDLAVLALLTAAKRVEEASGEGEAVFHDIYRLMGLRRSQALSLR